MSKFVFTKQSELRVLKEKIWIKNNMICPLLNRKLAFDKSVADHAHKRKDEEISTTKGVIRDCIEFRANAFLGKIENAFKRYGFEKEGVSISDLLINCANYLEKPAYNEDNVYYVYPSEVPKEPNLSKKNYNKLKKIYLNSGKKTKFPIFPVSGKLTIKLKALFDEFNIEYYN